MGAIILSHKHEEFKPKMAARHGCVLVQVADYKDN
jgi:hypothetical protein